jgi:hypothetical protein
MLKQDVERECRIAGIIFRTAAGKRAAQPGEQVRIDRVQHQVLRLRQRIDQRPAALLQTDRHRPVVEAPTQLVGPVVDRLGLLL